MKADLLLTNATFRTITGPDRSGTARSLAIWRDRIVAVDEDVAAHRVVDLDGAVVVPGFHDAHNHMAWFGLTLGEIDLRLPSLDAVYAAVAARARAGGDEWIIGSGYDQSKLDGHPTREALDAAAPGRKVWLKHTSGHMCVVSSAVLAELGIADQPVEVAGGVVAVDASGRPTGLLEETAQSLLSPLVLPYPVTTLVEAIERAGRVYLSEGITSVVEAGIGGGWIGKSPVEVAAYQAARESGRLPVRVELMVASDVLHPLAGHRDDGLPLGLDLGLRTGLGDDRLRIGPVKVFSDGSLIGHTCSMTDDFADSPGRGYLQDDADRLRTLILDAHRSGWRVATHAIGDAAIDLVLDTYAEAQRLLPRPDVRHRIEHFGVGRPDQVARAAELGVIPVPQGRFVGEIGDGMLRSAGPDRVGWVYRAKSFLDAGIVLPGSSDRPVVAGAPLLGMHDLVHRITETGADFAPQERITGLQALTAYTYGSAYSSHAEADRGTLEVGKYADLAVLSDDPADPGLADRIREIDVLATYLAGERVWSR